MFSASSRFLLLGLVSLVFNACAVHTVTTIPEFTPKLSFSGRLLVLNPNKRFQVELDWQAEGNQGKMRITHALSGRVVYVNWHDETMLWRNGGQQFWQPLLKKDLFDMGIVFPPWTLAKIFRGEMPDTMKTKDGRMWKGYWNKLALKVKWAEDQHKLEVIDSKHGRRAVVIFND